MTGDTCENATEAAQETPGAAQAPPLDLSAIRRTLGRGDPVFPALVLELVERVEALEGTARALLAATAYAWTKPGEGTLILADAELRMEAVLSREGGELHTLLHAARAWRDAIERMDGVVAAEERLIAAIKGCEL